MCRRLRLSICACAASTKPALQRHRDSGAKYGGRSREYNAGHEYGTLFGFTTPQGSTVVASGLFLPSLRHRMRTPETLKGPNLRTVAL